MVIAMLSLPVLFFAPTDSIAPGILSLLQEKQRDFTAQARRRLDVRWVLSRPEGSERVLKCNLLFRIAFESLAGYSPNTCFPTWNHRHGLAVRTGDSPVG